MITKSYDRRQASSLIPLLRSLAIEVQERAAEIERLEWLQEELAKTERAHKQELAELRAQIACHKLELRRTRLEIEALGCEVEHKGVLMIRIPSHRRSGREAFAWRIDQPNRLTDVADSAA
ncbi:MAG: DUF2203 family protein [Planctomycetes bacterium]|jgi:ribosomal protein L29|nr:DUF2203 family protein [Planctomycetota bacterium]